MYYLNIEDPILMFKRAVNGKLYIDKSSLIDSVNELIGAYESYICVTRPRRFGKTMCANMLATYYTKGYDNHKLFENLKISKQDSYKQHVNYPHLAKPNGS